jgi:hypothetical protein
MKLNTVLFALVFVFAVRAARGQVAVIPYKIANASSDFPASMGDEYSRLISTAAFLSKQDVEIASPTDIDVDLERMKLSPQKTITREDLDILGKTRYIDYFLTGELSKAGKEYRSESILYSVREGKIVGRFKVRGEDLFRLAEREVNEAFSQYGNRQRFTGVQSSEADLVFLIDLSYGISDDWASVKEAVIGCAAELIDSMRVDTRIYIVPFSDRAGYSAGSVSENSITAVRTELDRLHPTGSAGVENFIGSLRYSVQNVRWRRSARKMIILIVDSPLGSRFDEKYALQARNKGASITSVSLGRISGEQCEAPDRLSRITGGSHYHVAYHQKIYTADGGSVDLYLENGRLFKSQFTDAGWIKGLYVAGQGSRVYGKPKSFLEEIFFNEKKDSTSPTPRTMADVYTRITKERIINQEKLENNMERLLKGLVAADGRRKGETGIVGKALVSDGRVSMWVYAHDKPSMAFLEKGRRAGYYVTLGVVVEKDPREAYGVTLVPAFTDLSPGYVPELMKTSLSDIIKKSDYFMSRGLFRPPVWFVSVKVDNVENYHIKRDIRER